MARWFSRKKESEYESTLKFEKDELQKQLNRLTRQVYSNRNSEGFKTLMKLIGLCKNIRILQVNQMKADSNAAVSLANHLGGVQIIGEIESIVQRMILDTKMRDEKGQPSGKRSMLQKDRNTVGMADF